MVPSTLNCTIPHAPGMQSVQEPGFCESGNVLHGELVLGPLYGIFSPLLPALANFKTCHLLSKIATTPNSRLNSFRGQINQIE